MDSYWCQNLTGIRQNWNKVLTEPFTEHPSGYLLVLKCMRNKQKPQKTNKK